MFRAPSEGLNGHKPPYKCPGVELNAEFKIESIREDGSLLIYAKKTFDGKGGPVVTGGIDMTHGTGGGRQEAGGSSCDNYDCVISQLCSVQEMLRWKAGGGGTNYIDIRQVASPQCRI